jgi:hypothetical protein
LKPLPGPGQHSKPDSFTFNQRIVLLTRPTCLSSLVAIILEAGPMPCMPDFAPLCR